MMEQAGRQDLMSQLIKITEEVDEFFHGACEESSGVFVLKVSSLKASRMNWSSSQAEVTSLRM